MMTEDIEKLAIEFIDNQFLDTDSQITEDMVLDWLIEFGNNITSSLPKEEEKEKQTLDWKLFNLANEFAVNQHGDFAVRLHQIHNEYLIYLIDSHP